MNEPILMIDFVSRSVVQSIQTMDLGCELSKESHK